MLPAALTLIGVASQGYIEKKVYAGRGAVPVRLPKGYFKDQCRSFPLVVQLHGYHLDASVHDDYLGLGYVINRHEVIVAMPNGRKDLDGNRYWMAWGEWTGSCSPELSGGGHRQLSEASDASYSYDYSYTGGEIVAPHEQTMNEGEIEEATEELDWQLQAKTPEFWWREAMDHCSGPDDDVNYIKALVAKISSIYRVDASRVSVHGHSNGAAMAYRMVCDAAHIFSSAVAIAGSPPFGSFVCKPSRPIRVLHIQGTRDGITEYNGGFMENGTQVYHGAVQAVEMMRRINKCRRPQLPTSATGTDCRRQGASAAYDLSYFPVYSEGRETLEYSSGASECPPAASVTLWKVCGETHLPLVGWSYAKKVAEFLAWYEEPNTKNCKKKKRSRGNLILEAAAAVAPSPQAGLAMLSALFVVGLAGALVFARRKWKAGDGSLQLV